MTLKIENVFKIFLVILLGYFSCKDNNINESVKDISGKTDNCFSQSEKERIFNLIMETDEIKQHLDYLFEKDFPLLIKENAFFGPGLKLKAFNHNFSISNEEEVENLFEFKINVVDCNSKRLKFGVWYEFEHHDLTGTVYRLNDKWNIEILGSGIVD